MNSAVGGAISGLYPADHKSGNELISLLGNPTIWSLIGFAAGIYFFFRGFALLRCKRSILNVPKSTIRGASLGLVEVSGKVEGPYTITAPLSGKDCVYYRTVAWTGGGTSWRKAAQESLSAPFFLDDGTGKLMVDARGAQGELDAVFSEEYSDSVPDYAQHFLNRHGVSQGPRVRFEEYVVCQGEALFAMGTLRENPGEKSSDAVQFLSAEAAELQREEEMGGVLLPGAADRIQPTAAKVSPEFDLHPAVILGSQPGRPLFISIRSQRDIVQALAWKSTLYIWAGPILALICFWYLLSRLGPIKP